MTPAEGGNRPSSSSSSLPRDANGTKIERKKGAAIFSARECSTIHPRARCDDDAVRSVGANGGKSKREHGHRTRTPVGHIGGS